MLLNLIGVYSMATLVKRLNTLGNVTGAIQKTTFLKDVKSVGTAGGTFTSGVYQTRVLNTQEGDTSFCSLSANQFTLQPGTYEIEASAPAHFCNLNKIKLYNITTSSDSIIGSSSDLSTVVGMSAIVSRSVLSGRITLTTASIFELQHHCTVTAATNGLGVAVNFGTEVEVYSIVKITKIETLAEAY